jgi:superfamily II DNA or RNA helicase
MKPRYYQEDAVQAIFSYFLENTGNPIVAMPTGVGKSIVIGDFIKKVYQYYPTQRVMMLTHVKELIQQNCEKLLTMWPTAPVGVYSAGLRRRDSHCKITYAGIGSVVKKASLFGHIDLVLVDECHLISSKAETMYGKFLNALKNLNPALKIIGFTATPYRLGLGMLTEGDLFTEVCYDCTGLEAFNRLVSEGYIAPLVVRRTATTLDISEVGFRGGEFIPGQLQKAVDKAEVTAAALNELIDAGQTRKCWLIFATGIEHSKHIAEYLIAQGVPAAAIHSKLASSERGQILTDLKSGRLRAVVNNNVLTTGFDHPAIDLIGMLRPTSSTALWCLDEETEILTPEGFKSYNEVSIGSSIIGFDTESRQLVNTTVTNYVHRGLEKDENLLTYVSPQFTFSMTDTHNVLYEQRVGNGEWMLRKNQLSELTSKSNRRMIIATETHREGIGVNYTALNLLGLFLSEGSFDKSNNTLVIYQSERYPGICQEIERILTTLGLGWRRYTRPPGTKFDTVFKMRRYVIRRAVRATGKSGWSEYFTEKDFNKDLDSRFMDCNMNEFRALLYGINLGDGSKFKALLIYRKPKILTISTGNKKFASNIQILCIHNGYSCRIKETTNTSGNLLYRLYVRNKLAAAFSPEFLTRNTTAAKVWCVENPTGNLVTRYRGQVLITGNCQMLGRGTRPWEGKADCLVMDFSSNTERLGPVNDPVLPRAKGKGGGGAAPVRCCEKCDTYCHASLRVCPECGEVFPEKVKIHSFAASAEVMVSGGEVPDPPKVLEHMVDRVMYSQHVKVGRPPSILVSYFCGMRMFKQWVCLEHPGAAGNSAKKWWLDNFGEAPPTTTKEGLELLATAPLPKAIMVWHKDKYPEVLSRVN